MTNFDDESRIDHAVGEKIRQRRIALGVSQTALAKNIGVTFQQVQKMEKGINRVGAGRLWQIANILNIQVSYFYDEVTRLQKLDPEQQANHAAASRFLGRREGLRTAVALHDMNQPVRAALLRLITTIDDQAKIAAEAVHAKEGAYERRRVGNVGRV